MALRIKVYRDSKDSPIGVVLWDDASGDGAAVTLIAGSDGNWVTADIGYHRKTGTGMCTERECPTTGGDCWYDGRGCTPTEAIDWIEREVITNQGENNGRPWPLGPNDPMPVL